jgi:hypothetical protein
MNIDNKGVVHNDSLIFANEWWKQVYDILCKTEESQERFYTTYYDPLNVPNSILEFRNEVMSGRFNNILQEVAYKSRIKTGDIDEIVAVMEHIFCEPVNKQDVIDYMEDFQEMNFAGFFDYIKGHLGVRFVYAMKHYK